MHTKEQERWADLLDFLLGAEFDFECCWFEDANRSQLPGMANRIGNIENIPIEAKRLRIDGSIWARPGDSFDQDIQTIYEALATKPQFIAEIIGGKLYIELSVENAANN